MRRQRAMVDFQKTVFISYRRSTSKYLAMLIYKYLTGQSHDVFLDIESIDSGAFDQAILTEIEARAHFVLLLAPGTLNRCSEPGDWLRQEIEHAMRCERNIVPVLCDQFSFGDPEVKKYLSGSLTQLRRYNALELPYEFIDAGLEKLHRRFLRMPKHPVRPIVPKAAASKSPAVSTLIAAPPHDELLSENHLFRAFYHYERHDFARALEALDKSLQLNPTFVEALNNRGITRYQMKDYDGAIADLSEVIRLRPTDPRTYNNRAAALRAKGDLPSFRQALDDYRTYLQLGGADGAEIENTILYMKLVLRFRNLIGR